MATAAALGLVGSTAGLLLGYFGAANAAGTGFGADCDADCDLASPSWGVIGGVAGGALGAALLGYAGAELVGGEGELGWTLVGGATGALVGLSLAISAEHGDLGGGWIGLALIATPVVGAVLGYELSAGAGGAPAARIGLVPARGGAGVSVLGSF